MDTKTYSEREVQQIVRRYASGDTDAGAVVDALTKGRQRETDESYGVALRAILRTLKRTESEPRPRTEIFSEASYEIERWTVKLMADLNIDRRTAIRLACGLCPDHYGPAYTGFPVKRLSVDEVYRQYGNRQRSR